MKLCVAVLAYTPAPFLDQHDGHLGWVRIGIDRRIVIDGISVRRCRRGQFALSFPTRRDSSGNRHAIVFLPSASDRGSVEDQVIRQLLRERRIAS